LRGGVAAAALSAALPPICITVIAVEKLKHEFPGCLHRNGG